MNVLVVSGIWPPDVGGPASHAPELAAWLARPRPPGRGDRDGRDARPARPATRCRSSRARCRAASDTPKSHGRSHCARGMPTSSTRPGCSPARSSARPLARTPLVVKLTSDPAFERARRRGRRRWSRRRVPGRRRRPARCRAARIRDFGIRRAAHVVCPSSYMVELAVSWGATPGSSHAPAEPGARRRWRSARDARCSPCARVRRSVDGRQGSRCRLRVVVCGARGSSLDRRRRSRPGSPRAASRRARPAGPGPVPRCAPEVGGARLDARGGCGHPLVGLGELSPRRRRGARGRDAGCCNARRRRAGDRHRRRERAAGRARRCAAFGAALRRILADDELRVQLAGRAAASVARFSAAEIYGRLEQILERAAAVRPRVLFVGRARYALPLRASLERKWSAVGRVLDYRVVASSPDGSTGDETFRLRRRTALDGPRFWLSLPLRLRREVRQFRPDAIVAQSPYEAAAALAARTGVPVIVELHGDWRTFARLYGSPARRRLGRLADAIGDWAVRRAAKVRAVSPYTAELARAAGREPDAEFPAFMDLEPFTVPVRPLPDRPVILFIGVLELVQERRWAGRGVAARARQHSRSDAADRRRRDPRRPRSEPRRRGPRLVGPRASTRTRSSQHSTRPACSSCRRDRRGWDAS